MKINHVIRGFFLVFSFFLLSACQKEELTIPKTSTLETSTKIEQKKTVSKPTPTKPKSQSTGQDLKKEEAFVSQFLESYTTYSTLNAGKAAIEPLVTKELGKALAVDQPATSELNAITSKGEDISIWHNEKGDWLGLVTINVNQQIQSTEVFLIGLEIDNERYLVSQLCSPTQE